MAPDQSLLSRIRGEYREMPGLRLTFTQACRLWQLDGPTCHRVLDKLLGERFLQCTADGSYTVFSFPSPTPAKSSLRSSDRPHVSHRRHRA